MIESDFFSFKERNRREKRIFAYDKPNKFYDEFHLKSLCFNAIKSLKEQIKELKIKEDDISKFLRNFPKEKKSKFLVSFLLIYY